jgi:hypothetical protein
VNRAQAEIDETTRVRNFRTRNENTEPNVWVCTALRMRRISYIRFRIDSTNLNLTMRNIVSVTAIMGIISAYQTCAFLVAPQQRTTRKILRSSFLLPGVGLQESVDPHLEQDNNGKLPCVPLEYLDKREEMSPLESAIRKVRLVVRQ